MASGTESLLKGRWTIWILSLIFALIAGYGVLSIISSAAEQVTYYVAATSIPPKTALTGDMIQERTANADGVPATALTAQQLESQPLYTKIALRAGEPITASNVGPASRITVGLPPDFVAASLAVPPENAAAGKIVRGDYVDIAAVYDDGEASTSKVILHNVLVLDVSVAPDTIARAATTPVGGAGDGTAQQGVDSAAYRSGIPQLYTFAVSPRDFVTLAMLRDASPYLALSQGGDGDVIASVTTADVFGPGAAANAGVGTEDTLSQQDNPTDPAASAAPSSPATPSGAATPGTVTAPSATPANP